MVNGENDPTVVTTVSRRHPAACAILSIVSTAKIAYAIAKNPFLFYGYPGRLDILPMFLRYFSSFHFVGWATNRLTELCYPPFFFFLIQRTFCRAKSLDWYKKKDDIHWYN